MTVFVQFLTTHTGSLPRPDDLIQIMWAKADGIPVDENALTTRISLAAEQIVEKQIAAGARIEEGITIWGLSHLRFLSLAPMRRRIHFRH